MFIRALLGKHESRAGELAEQVDSSNYMDLDQDICYQDEKSQIPEQLLALEMTWGDTRNVSLFSDPRNISPPYRSLSPLH